MHVSGKFLLGHDDSINAPKDDQIDRSMVLEIQIVYYRASISYIPF